MPRFRYSMRGQGCCRKSHFNQNKSPAEKDEPGSCTPSSRPGRFVGGGAAGGCGLCLAAAARNANVPDSCNKRGSIWYHGRRQVVEVWSPPQPTFATICLRSLEVKRPSSGPCQLSQSKAFGLGRRRAYLFQIMSGKGLEDEEWMQKQAFVHSARRDTSETMSQAESLSSRRCSSQQLHWLQQARAKAAIGSPAIPAV